MNARERIESLAGMIQETGLTYETGLELARDLHRGRKRNGLGTDEHGNAVVLDLRKYLAHRLTQWGGMDRSDADALLAEFLTR